MADPTVEVSVLIPAYNAATTIGRAIASALRQTESRLEIIVIDDASTDATIATTARLAAQDGRVQLLRQSINRGPAAARNRGLAKARGNWIALLDADDEFLPDRIGRLVAWGEQQSADIVADNLLLCAEGGIDDDKPMLAPELFPRARWMSAAEFVAGNVGSRFTPRVSYGFMQPVMRRGFLEAHDIHYDERNRFGEDFLLSLDCLLNGARWWVTPEPMYRYTVRPGSATDIQSAADLSRIRTYEAAALCNHPMVAAEPALAAALRQHKAVIEHFYYYRAFTDALKARTVTPALHLLLESPRSFRHIVTESALQGPRVAIKALRGGYRGRRSKIATIAGTSASHKPRQQV